MKYIIILIAVLLTSCASNTLEIKGPSFAANPREMQFVAYKGELSFCPERIFWDFGFYKVTMSTDCETRAFEILQGLPCGNHIVRVVLYSPGHFVSAMKQVQVCGGGQ